MGTWKSFPAEVLCAVIYYEIVFFAADYVAQVGYLAIVYVHDHKIDQNWFLGHL